VHFGLFRYYTKLGAKWVELVQLMQKFVPWSHIIIFRKGRPRSTHLTLNSCIDAFHSVWVHLAKFRYYMKPGSKQFELVQLMQKFVTRTHIGIFATNAPDPPHWTLNSCLRASRSVWEHLAMFRYYTKLSAKTNWTGAINAKVRATKSHRNFRNERTRSTPLDPKLMFWCVS
jgi:hypothetical protein